MTKIRIELNQEELEDLDKFKEICIYGDKDITIIINRKKIKWGGTMIEQSKGWCCELCGALIKGKCINEKGYVTHINNCSNYEVKKWNVQNVK